jgi:hypothetical protein
MHREGEWRASKLVGVNVYNEANEKISDINEVILDKSGKVAHVVLGVGGFLGMGEHYVAVAFDKAKVGERTPRVRPPPQLQPRLLTRPRPTWTPTLVQLQTAPHEPRWVPDQNPQRQ